MKKIIIVLITAIFQIACVQAQESPDWIPELTEVWEPVPVAVMPGVENKPPSDAIVLFDGSNLDAWEGADWNLEDGIMTVNPGSGNIRTKEAFGDIQLHIEWHTPKEIVGEGQGRGNSGIFLQGRYEIQILDSYDNKTYPNGQAGSVYKQHIPLVNASIPPGEWQTYDIIFTAPIFKDDGRLAKPAYVTILHNGVLIQNHVEVKGPTKYIGLPEYEKHSEKLPIVLQDHTNHVSFRNIWVREF
ncbi:MAG: DUF1080 domain-containing protein [Balneolales bacterium]